MKPCVITGGLCTGCGECKPGIEIIHPDAPRPQSEGGKGTCQAVICVRCGETISGKYTLNIKSGRAICKDCREDVAFGEVTQPELVEYLKDRLEGVPRNGLLFIAKFIGAYADDKFAEWYYSGNFAQMDTREGG
jgi:hypothetical protein